MKSGLGSQHSVEKKMEIVSAIRKVEAYSSS
jgi:hypothetical protein